MFKWIKKLFKRKRKKGYRGRLNDIMKQVISIVPTETPFPLPPLWSKKDSLTNKPLTEKQFKKMLKLALKEGKKHDRSRVLTSGGCK